MTILAVVIALGPLTGPAAAIEEGVAPYDSVDVVICPPAISLLTVRETLGSDPRLTLVTEDGAAFLRRQSEETFDLDRR